MNDFNGMFIRYVGKQFALRFIGLLAFFVIVLQMLDLLNSSEKITAPDGAGMASILQYISLRAPQIVSQFAPFAALLSIVVTLLGLNIRSEIVIMRAAGMSIHRVLFPIGVVCFAIAILHFAFHELVVVPSSQKLSYWEANDYALDLPAETTTRTDVRILHGGEVIFAASAARTGDGGMILKDVEIFPLDESGLAGGLVEARRGVYKDGAWTLYQVSERRGPSGAAVERPEQAWANDLDPELLFAMTIDPERSSLGDLARQITELRRDGADSRSAMTSFLSRLSKPMSTLVMPLLGAIAGFGVSRQGNQLARATIGAVLGFGYFVTENLMLAIGKLGVAPPMIAAFFPLALFLVVGFAILLAMEN
ncbi:MAG: LPS export ABC transporter permease LptG [Parvularculaceae bacterium]